MLLNKLLRQVMLIDHKKRYCVYSRWWTSWKRILGILVSFHKIISLLNPNKYKARIMRDSCRSVLVGGLEKEEGSSRAGLMPDHQPCRRQYSASVEVISPSIMQSWIMPPMCCHTFISFFNLSYLYRQFINRFSVNRMLVLTKKIPQILKPLVWSGSLV